MTFGSLLTRNVTKFGTKTIVPFTESDFDTYFSAIFAMDFMKTFQQIDIEKLKTLKFAESPELEVVKPAKSKMEAKYLEATNTVTLTLITKSPDFGKFTIDYHFRILASGNIKFSHVKFDL